MYGNITGIDITGEHLTAIQTRSSLKGRRITGCTRVPIQEGDLDAALKSLEETLSLRNDTCIVTLPDETVSFRNLQMPFRDVKKIRQALPFEMESMLAVPIDELLIDFMMTDTPSGGGVFAVSVKKTFVADYLDRLRANGIDPDVLEVRGVALASWVLSQPGIPDHLLVLEIGRERHTLALCLKKRIALIRSFSSTPFFPPLTETAPGDVTNGSHRMGDGHEQHIRALCTAIHLTVHAYLSSVGSPDQPQQLYYTGEGATGTETANLLTQFLGMPVHAMDVTQDKRIRPDGVMTGGWAADQMNTALSLALRNGGKQEGFNLRREEFSREKRYLGLRRQLPRIIVFLILIFSFLAADVIIDTYSLKQEYGTLDQEITAIFRRTLPKTTRMVDPVQQLRISVAELKRSSALNPAAGPNTTILELLREISQRIPSSIHLEVRRLVADPDTVRISGTTDAFKEVDQIKNDLAAATLFGPVNITSANLDRSGKKVQFDITIERKR